LLGLAYWARTLTPFHYCSALQKKLATQGVHCEHVVITAVDLVTFSPAKRNE
jgi:hypothetical protein